MAGTTSKSTIYREIRRSIIMEHRKPGERLDVTQIAHQYNTSITPVRDALQMLTQEGLVTIKPRSGYFVTRMTLKQLRDMMELRKILELAAVERAAQRITPEKIQELRSVHAGYTGDDDESYDRYTDENRHFHYALAQASGNQELAETIGRLHDRLARFMVLRHAGLSQEFSHAHIIEALEKHDVEASKRALLDDIAPAHDEILDEILEESANNWNVDTVR